MEAIERARESFYDFRTRMEGRRGGRPRTFLAESNAHDRVQHQWTIEASTYLPQSNMPDEKVVVVQRVRLSAIIGGRERRGARRGDVEYRYGYYMRDRRGLWMWARNAPHIRPDDRKVLERRARAEGTVLRQHAI